MAALLVALTAAAVTRIPPQQSELVVSEANRDALAGLLRFTGREPSEWAFDTVEAAVQALERQVQAEHLRTL